MLVSKTAEELWNVKVDPGQIEQIIVNLVVDNVTILKEIMIC